MHLTLWRRWYLDMRLKTALETINQQKLTVYHLSRLLKQKNWYLLGLTTNYGTIYQGTHVSDDEDDDAANMHQVKASPPVPMRIRLANIFNPFLLGPQGGGSLGRPSRL